MLQPIRGFADCLRGRESRHHHATIMLQLCCAPEQRQTFRLRLALQLQGSRAAGEPAEPDRARAGKA
jgi:hypothetical protein